MSVDVTQLTDSMISAGEGLASGVWSKMKSFAGPELNKIAIQIAELAKPDSPWSREEKKILFDMQIKSAITVIVGMTALTLQLVQDAINQILAAVKDLINGAIGIAVI